MPLFCSAIKSIANFASSTIHREPAATLFVASLKSPYPPGLVTSAPPTPPLPRRPALPRPFIIARQA